MHMLRSNQNCYRVSVHWGIWYDVEGPDAKLTDQSRFRQERVQFNLGHFSTPVKRVCEWKRLSSALVIRSVHVEGMHGPMGFVLHQMGCALLLAAKPSVCVGTAVPYALYFSGSCLKRWK